MEKVDGHKLLNFASYRRQHDRAGEGHRVDAVRASARCAHARCAPREGLCGRHRHPDGRRRHPRCRRRGHWLRHDRGPHRLYRVRACRAQCLAALRLALETAIPLSPGNYNADTDRYPFTKARIELLEELADKNAVDLNHSPHWRVQLGSLGGGNHFIELCVDEQHRVWMFLHSGSRGVGNKIATKHIKSLSD